MRELDERPSASARAVDIGGRRARSRRQAGGRRHAAPRRSAVAAGSRRGGDAVNTRGDAGDPHERGDAAVQRCRTATSSAAETADTVVPPAGRRIAEQRRKAIGPARPASDGGKADPPANPTTKDAQSRRSARRHGAKQTFRWASEEGIGCGCAGAARREPPGCQTKRPPLRLLTSSSRARQNAPAAATVPTGRHPSASGSAPKLRAEQARGRQVPPAPTAPTGSGAAATHGAMQRSAAATALRVAAAQSERKQADESAAVWLERIIKLRREGRHDEADAELKRFRERYPQVPQR